MSSATILEPSGQTDSTLKFTAGLIMSVPFEAELRNLESTSRLRLKVKYPDQKAHIILPRPAHMKPLYMDGQREGIVYVHKINNVMCYTKFYHISFNDQFYEPSVVTSTRRL